MVRLSTQLAAIAAVASTLTNALPYPGLTRPLEARAPAANSSSASLPNVQIFATGGTISGASPVGDDTDVTNYKAGAFTISELIDDLPALRNVSRVSGIQYANVDSGAINTTFALTLARDVQRALNANDSLAGAVVTHGTDTLEETAFMLELTVASPKPVVMAAAMRPKSAISSDGEFNLLQAVSLAASEEARHRGTLVVLNDRIGSAYYASKTNPRSLDTFKAPEAGFLGTFEGTAPYFWYAAARPGYLAHNSKFDLESISSLPKVAILYAYQEMDVALLDAAVNSGHKGIVIAGMGNGAFSPEWKDRVQELADQGIPIVVSTRTGAGTVTGSDPVVGAGSLNPQKAKILLQLVLGTTQGGDDKLRAVRKAFEFA